MAEPLNYKGYPLVRCDDELYYGNPSDSHVICVRIIESEEQEGVRVATKTHVQLLANATAKGSSPQVIRESDKQGLYNALEIGTIWLKRALAEK